MFKKFSIILFKEIEKKPKGGLRVMFPGINSLKRRYDLIHWQWQQEPSNKSRSIELNALLKKVGPK